MFPVKNMSDLLLSSWGIAPLWNMAVSSKWAVANPEIFYETLDKMRTEFWPFRIRPKIKFLHSHIGTSFKILGKTTIFRPLNTWLHSVKIHLIYARTSLANLLNKYKANNLFAIIIVLNKYDVLVASLHRNELLDTALMWKVHWILRKYLDSRIYELTQR